MSRSTLHNLAQKLRLYVIVDPDLCDGRDPIEVTAAAIRGGATAIQLRAKQRTGAEVLRLARALRQTIPAEVLFIVNDRPDVAVMAGADGVHLGPDDLPHAAVKEAFPHLIVGGSAGTHDRAQELTAGPTPVDYLGVGAIYEARTSKANASPPRGPEAVAKICAITAVPIVGIGGITAQNAHEVRDAGACGVAVIRAVCGAEDVERAANELARPQES